MFNIYGKYTGAVIYSNICEPDALSLIYDLCNHPLFKDASIRIMPDVHSGVGCAVGTTVKMKGGAVIPSIVGADVGCGVLTVIFERADDIDYKATVINGIRGRIRGRNVGKTRIATVFAVRYAHVTFVAGEKHSGEHEKKGGQSKHSFIHHHNSFHDAFVSRI